MTKPARPRLDQLLVDRGLVSTRSAARALVMAGLVEVGGKVVDKAGTPVPPHAELHLKERPRFVSRAGEKLAHALGVFALDVRGARALDVGASTGGFVDCLLQAGAAEVIALDVGYGQLNGRLRQDPRVHVLDRMNARYLRPQELPYQPDLLTVDVAFIGLEKILPAVLDCMAPRFSALLLVKPQFEAGPNQVGKGGVVRDPRVHRDVLQRVLLTLMHDLALAVQGLTESGLPGTSGNIEFVVHATRGGEAGLSPATLGRLVEQLSGAGPEDGPAELRLSGGPRSTRSGRR
jgi:23S rRNA (cytidine1920-2'-O)/16S rRNA (cytidine1409-2'-O)-methyltransferase